MKKIIILVLVIILNTHLLVAQHSYTKIVMGKDSKKPIDNAHVYNTNELISGTVTNEDGKFVLQNITKNNTIEIKHISYNTYKNRVSNISGDTIWLQERYNMIGEVSVETGKSLILKVIDNLEKNHYVEPVMYEVFIKVVCFERDSSEIHVLSEYSMNFYQNKQSKSEIEVVKTRAKPLSKAGKKYFKDMRMINAISINSDNLFRFKNDILKKKKIKNFHISIKETYNDNNIIISKLTATNKNDSIVLFINTDTYAITRMITYYSKSQNTFKEIGFKKINDKWYLDYSYRQNNSEAIKKWKKNSDAISSLSAIYNINKSVKYNKTTFKTAFNLVAEPIKYHIGDWSDSYWENRNYIPISKKIIKNN